MIRWVGLAVIAGSALLCAAAPAYRWSLPEGIAPPPVPPDNPMSDAKVALGRRLFYDADLSVDGTLACATCHEQRHGFAESEKTHGGVRGALGRRNVMTLANVGYLTPLTWADARQMQLEAQMATPMQGEHPVEMGMAGQETELVRRLSADKCYKQMFAGAFPETGGQISYATTVKAIASFERTLNSWNSPYDLANRGDATALPAAARAGEVLFKAKGCGECHSGPNFTDQRFHAIGPVRGDDHGEMEWTGHASDNGLFRTPSLRNVELSAPYLHDGHAPTLAAAILDHDSALPTLTPDDVYAIEAFLDSLTDKAFIANPALSLPREACGRPR
jgi:cytochrome c peroxidase